MFKKIVLSCTLLLFSLCAIGFGAAASSYQSTIELARNELWKTLGNGAASNAEVAIMDHGVIVYQEAFGITNRARSEAATNDTQFNLGSISKLFVTTAILQLVDQGKVALDQPITRYLPEFKMQDARYKQITVRMLLNHSTGIAGTNYFLADSTEYNSGYIAQTIALLQNGYLKSQPGAISVYCNDGFTLAQAIVERVAKTSYANYIERNIFSRAVMNNSSAGFKPFNLNIAHDFAADSGYLYPIEYVSALGSGGLTSTATDMCYFTQSLFAGELMSASSLKEFQSAQYAPFTAPVGTPMTHFGLGWDDVAEGDYALQGLTVLSKSGGTAEFSTQIRTVPAEQLTVVVLLSGHASASAINSAILKSALATKGLMKLAPETPQLPKPNAAVPKELSKYEGLYGAAGNIIRLKLDFNENTLSREVLVNGEFSEKGAFAYTGNNLFFAKGDYSLFFAAANDQNFLMAQSSAMPGAMVYYQQLNATKQPVDTAAFADKIWVPKNLGSTDLASPVIIKTEVVPNIEGIIAVGNGKAVTAYGLMDRNTAKIILPYASDLADIRITLQDGTSTLHCSGYQYTDATALPLMLANVAVKIGASGYNEVRRIAEPTIFTPYSPLNSRVAIFSDTGDLLYDSLANGQQPGLLAPGAYIVFIGAAGTEFSVSMFTR